MYVFTCDWYIRICNICMCLPVIDIYVYVIYVCVYLWLIYVYVKHVCVYLWLLIDVCMCVYLWLLVAPTLFQWHIYVCAYSHIDTCIFMHMYMYMCIDIRIYAYPVAVMGWHRSLLQKRPIKETTCCKRAL